MSIYRQEHTKHNTYRGLRISVLGILALLVICAVPGITARNKKASQWDTEAQRRKADYVYLTALDALCRDSDDVALRLMNYALCLNPDDKEIAAEEASFKLSALPVDSTLLTQAYNALKASWEETPDDYISGEYVARVAGALQRTDDLIEIWSKLDSLFPAKTDPAINLASAYLMSYVRTMDTTLYNKALNIYDRMETGTGKDLGLSSQKIRAYMLRNDTVSVLREIDTLQRAIPADVRIYLYSAAIYDRLGRDSLTLSNYRRATEIDSTDGRAFLHLAQFYRQRNDSVAYDREVFNALQSQNLDFETKNELLRGYISELYTDSTQWERIESLFGVLGRTNPGEANMHALYGAFEAARNQVANSIEQFSYAVDLDPTDDQLWMSLIRAEFVGDSLERLAHDAKRAAKLFPQNYYFHIMGASVLDQLGRPAEGIELLKSADISVVNNKEAVSNLLTSLGDTYYKNNMPDSAFVQYEEALKYNKENDMAYNNAGYFLAEQNRDLDKALKYAQYAVLMQPSNPTYLDTYAWVYFKRKDYQEARKQIDVALRMYNEAYGVVDTVEVEEWEVEKDADATITDTTGITDTTSVLDGLVVTDSDFIDIEDDSPAEPDYDSWDAGSAEILNHAGDIYFMCGEPEKALMFWEKALAKKPDDELLKKKVSHKTFFFE